MTHLSNLLAVVLLVASPHLGNASQDECSTHDPIEWMRCQLEKNPKNDFEKQTGYRVIFDQDFSSSETNAISRRLEALLEDPSIYERAFSSIRFRRVLRGKARVEVRWTPPSIEFVLPGKELASKAELLKWISMQPSKQDLTRWQTKASVIEASVGYQIYFGMDVETTLLDRALDHMTAALSEKTLPLENGSETVYLGRRFVIEKFHREFDVAGSKAEIMRFLARSVRKERRYSARSCAAVCASAQCVGDDSPTYQSTCKRRDGSTHIEESSFSVGDSTCTGVPSASPGSAPRVPDCTSCTRWKLIKWGECYCAP
jgi:hypothetical protein